METAHETGVRPFRFSREDYHRAGEAGLFDGRRVELIRGRIVEMSAMGPAHRDAICCLNECLVKADLPGIQVGCRTPVPIPGDSEPEPDFTLAPRLIKGAEPKDEVEARLLIEVSASTLGYDLREKAALYAEGEVPEYWVVDLDAKETVVHREPVAGSYSSIQRVPWTSRLASSAVAGLTVTLSDVLW